MTAWFWFSLWIATSICLTISLWTVRQLLTSHRRLLEQSEQQTDMILRLTRDDPSW